MIKLNKKHEYSIGKKRLKSVTEFISLFFEPFNAKEIARKLAKFPINKEKKQGVRYWLKKWAFSRSEGTKIHKEIERFIKDGVSCKHIKAQSAERFIKEFYPKNIILSEQVIYSEELGLAGTVDAIVRTDDGVILLDWKSNEKITQVAYKNKKGILPPTSNTPDSNYWHYALQLNIYAYILTNYYKEKVIGMKLIQVGDNEFSVMEIPAMLDVIGEMFKYKEG